MLEKYGSKSIRITPLNHREVLEFDTQLECYRMLITNYSMVLVGKGRNVKILIFKIGSEQQKQELQQFYNEHSEELESLKNARDKAYSHFDENLRNGKIEQEFIEELVIFLKQLLGAEGVILEKKETDL